MHLPNSMMLVKQRNAYQSRTLPEDITREIERLEQAGWAASNGVYLDGALNAEYFNNTYDVGGSLMVGYRW